MRKIIYSLFIIGVAAAIVVGVTVAFFSDTEMSRGNTFSLGTVEISINGALHWAESFTWDNIEPGDSAEFTMIIKNEGDDPVKLWQLLKCLITNENGVIEPEGDWYATYNSGNAKNDIDTAIIYEMYIDGKLAIAKEAGISLDKIKDYYLGLKKLDPGAIPAESNILLPGASITVVHRYFLPTATENWAQSDKLTFALELEARQTDAPEPLQQMNIIDNKYPGGVALADETMGILKYDYLAPTFNYNFFGVGLNQSSEYCLIYYADGWPGNHPGYFFQSGYPDGTGKLVLTGQAALGMNLPALTDANYLYGAKIWLVNCANYDKNNRAITGWSPNNWLFDNWPGFINYRQGERPNEVITCEDVEDNSNNNNGGDSNGAPVSQTITFADLGADPQYGYPYNYASSSVTFTYNTPSTDKISGALTATGLKPYATYQLKFEAVPTCRDAVNGDNALNEIIGYKGRWWNYTDEQNNSDTDYESNMSDCIAGYLVWDYVTADGSGNVTKTVSADNSYHVLRCGGGVCNTVSDSFLVYPDIAHPSVAFCPADKVNGEIERVGCAGLTLAAGNYNLRFILNEESFHMGPGTWTAVMDAPIEFELN